MDSGVGKEEWVSVQRKKKPSGGEGRVRMIQATFGHYLAQYTLLAQALHGTGRVRLGRRQSH